MSLLEVEQLEKRFDGEAEPILKGIDLTVCDGEFLAVMGRSGSGKSTLLYNISGMDAVTKGKIKFGGNELTTMKEEEMSRVRLESMGFVFQHSYLLKNLTVKENILLPALKLKKNSKKDMIKKADVLLERLGLTSVADHEISKISGGQLQRAAIARALMNSPKILFADEPTGALNSGTTREVMDIFQEINKDQTTLVMVTHDALVAARADRVIFLSDGRIQAELRLGKETGKQNLGERKQMLDQWLTRQGF